MPRGARGGRGGGPMPPGMFPPGPGGMPPFADLPPQMAAQLMQGGGPGIPPFPGLDGFLPAPPFYPAMPPGMMPPRGAYMPHHGGFPRGGGGMPPRHFMPPGPRMGGGYNNGMPRGNGMRGGRGGRGGYNGGPKPEDSNGGVAQIETSAQNGEEQEAGIAIVPAAGEEADAQKNGDVLEVKTEPVEEAVAPAAVPQQPEVKEVKEESSSIAATEVKVENGAAAE